MLGENMEVKRPGGFVVVRSASELEKEFGDLGIDPSRPEFYNQPAFKRAEENDSSFLETYAEYVVSRHYPAPYLDWVRATLPEIVTFLCGELARDGREGACLDAALAITKILEQMGIWNFVAAGSLTIDFDSTTGLGTRYWAHLIEPGKEATVGHAWIVAPPFTVLDITIRQQPGAEDQRPFLPELVVSDESMPVEGVSFDDMIDQDLKVSLLRRHGSLPTIHEVMKGEEEVARVMKKFRPFAIKTVVAILKYFPCMITAPMEPFEEHTGHCFSGRTTKQVFEDLRMALDGRVDLDGPST